MCSLSENYVNGIMLDIKPFYFNYTKSAAFNA
jgi:hypothetical protein